MLRLEPPQSGPARLSLRAVEEPEAALLGPRTCHHSAEARWVPLGRQGGWRTFDHQPVASRWKCSVSSPKLSSLRASVVAQMVKNLPAMWDTWVQPRGREDPLEKGMATTHCSFLAWIIPWTEEPSGRQSMGSQRVIGRN